MYVLYVVYRRKKFSILNLNILFGKKILSNQEKLKIKKIRLFYFFCNLKTNTHGYLHDFFTKFVCILI